MHRAVPRIVLLVITMLAVAGLAWGGSSRTPSKTVAKASSKRIAKSSTLAGRAAKHSSTRVASSGAAMRIFKDPDTGEVGPPTAETAAALARQNPIEVDRAALPTFKLAHGGVGVVTDQIEDALVVKLDSKGHRVIICTNDPKTALKSTAPVAPAQREDR